MEDVVFKTNCMFIFFSVSLHSVAPYYGLGISRFYFINWKRGQNVKYQYFLLHCISLLIRFNLFSSNIHIVYILLHSQNNDLLKRWGCIILILYFSAQYISWPKKIALNINAFKSQGDSNILGLRFFPKKAKNISLSWKM